MSKNMGRRATIAHGAQGHPSGGGVSARSASMATWDSQQQQPAAHRGTQAGGCRSAQPVSGSVRPHSNSNRGAKGTQAGRGHVGHSHG